MPYGISCGRFSGPRAPAPTAVSPTNIFVPSGEGTTVTLTGSGFTDATSVTVDGVAATFTVVNDTTITFPLPAGVADSPTRTVDIVVVGPGGSGTLEDQLTLTQDPE